VVDKGVGKLERSVDKLINRDKFERRNQILLVEKNFFIPSQYLVNEKAPHLIGGLF